MSTNPRIYLDFNATAPLIPAAREAMTAALADVGNPSSIHAEGRAARHRVEEARDRVAALAGCAREQVVFTSGGTEANALGVLGLAAAVERRGGPRVAVGSPIDHPSLRGALAALAARGWEVRMLAVSSEGAPVPAPLEGAGLLAYAAVNHELGTLADTSALGASARAAGALVHIDAVQAAGKLSLSPLTAAADSLALSAHKLGGPAGAGALALSAAAEAGLPLVDGGHQERGRRPGTENLVGIAGFGAAASALAAASSTAAWAAVAALGDRLERGLLSLPDVRIHGAGAPRVGGTINAGFAGALGESIVAALDLAGISAATGSACTSGSVRPSPVLLALGLAPAAARSAVRFSLGRTTTASEINAVLERLPPILSRARAHGAPRSF